MILGGYHIHDVFYDSL